MRLRHLHRKVLELGKSLCCGLFTDCGFETQTWLFRRCDGRVKPNSSLLSAPCHPRYAYVVVERAVSWPHHLFTHLLPTHIGSCSSKLNVINAWTYLSLITSRQRAHTPASSTLKPDLITQQPSTQHLPYLARALTTKTSHTTRDCGPPTRPGCNAGAPSSPPSTFEPDRQQDSATTHPPAARLHRTRHGCAARSMELER